MTETIAGHIAEGRECLRRLRHANVSPSTPMYAALTQESIAHTLTAIAMILDGQDRPGIPGLPKGYDIMTQQTGNGNRKWRYVVTGPQFSYASRHRWDTSESALGAGILHCQEHAELAPERARPPAGQNGGSADGRIDVHGIADPEAD